MKIRKLDVEEHSKTRPLYETVFSEDSQSFVDYYYTEKTKDNQIYVAEEDGGIRAMLHLNPYHLLVNEREKDAHYIVAVATEETYRKRGYMAELMRQALRDMYQAGESFTFLMPAAESIYLPHDFRTVYEQEQRYYKGLLPEKSGTLRMTEQDTEGLECGEVCVSLAEAKDCAELAEFANAALSASYQVFAHRDAAYYERLIKEYESDGGALTLFRKDGKIIDCHPYVPEEPEHTNPKIMIRIVDVRRMLLSVSLRSLTAVCFQVTDPVIAENSRCLVITGTEFSGVMLMDGKEENSEGTITIAALGSLLFGAKTVEEVWEEDGVHMSGRMREEMKKIIPLSRIFLNEIV